MSEHEARLCILFETMAEGVIMIAPDGEIVEANPAAERILGLKRSEITGRSYVSPDWRTLRPDGTPMPAEEMAGPRAMKERRLIKDVVMGIEHPDGSVAWISVNASPILNPAGELEGVVGTFVDITERKHEEEAVQSLKTQTEFILGATRTGLDIVDADFNVVYVDPEWQKTLGDHEGRKCYEYFAGRIEPCPGCGVPRALETRQMVVSDQRLPKEGGRAIQVTTIPFLSKEGEWLVAEINVDVTERKLIEEALEYSERNYRTLVESIPQKVFLKDRDSVYISCNGRYAEDHNIEPEDIPGHTDYDFYPRDLAEKYVADDRRVMQSGETARFEERYIEHGRERVVETFKTPVKDDDGNTIGLLGIFHDITERKQAEEELRESSARFDQLAEQNRTWVWEVDADGLYTYVSHVAEQVIGYKPEQLIGAMHFYELHPEEGREAFKSAAFEKFARKEPFFTLVNPIRARDGEIVWMSTNGIPVLNSDGSIRGYRGWDTDITERRQAEAAREEAERNYRLLAENTSDVVSIFDLDLNLVWVSPSIEKQTGYTPDEIRRVPPLETMTPESTERVIEAFDRAKQMYEQGKEFVDQFETQAEVYRKDGSTFWADIHYRLIRDGNGNPSYILMQGRDITKHRKADEALRESEERYRLIAENTSDSIWVMGPDLKITYQSPSTERFFGYRAEEWEAVGFGGWVHPDYIDTVVRTLKGFQTGDIRDSITITIKARHKSGHFFWMEICASAIRGTDGQLVAVAGVSRDITERKEAEERLIEYKAAVEQSADGIALVDLEGNVRFVNEAWAGMHGYAVEELIGRHLSVFHTREQVESQVMPFIDILRDRGSKAGEVWHVRRNGETFPTWMTTTILKRADGEPFGMFALMRDITWQKEMERQQREREIAEVRAEELSRSRSRLVESQESLRKDIASQLHGTVQNRLILLGHRLAELEARPSSERTTEELAGIRHSIEELQRDQIRPISHRLYPSILRLGIAAGLESLVDTYRSQLPIDLQVSTNLREREQANRKLVPDNVKLALYRVAEEVLTNVLKHASAVNSVVVKLALSDAGVLRLTVSDDGSGFQKPSRSHGIGLALVSDYAAAVGGSCTVKSVPCKGTRVTAQVQLAETGAGRRRKGRTSE